MMTKRTKYEKEKTPEPVWFVNPADGEVITLDLASVRFWQRA